MSDTITEGIRVQAEPQYLEERSMPESGQYVFAYRITISNLGEEPAKLVSRHWVVSDSTGQERHVRGPGVVGKQPRLEPREGFRYTSYCPLDTPVGNMRGKFQMVRDTGEQFDAEVGVFTLAAPYALN
jgi:ApaG protein